jgi:2-haloacid dehalogenase
VVTRADIPADGVPTTVVLDLGRVVVGWEPHLALADRLGADEWERFATEAGFAELNHAMDAGLSHAEALERLARTRPDHVPTLRRYCENFAATLTGPVPGTADVIDELAAAGVRLLGLTNWSAETFHHAAVAAPAIGRLEDVLVSGREGLVKPDPAIFRLLLDRYGLDPARTLFVDDSPPNVAAARAAGMLALRFTGAAALRRDLRALGIPVAAPET